MLVYFDKDFDLAAGRPYANYNWELLFHIPLTIAVHLSKNQRFAEAQRWFHYIFDPTCNDTTVPAPQRFWKFLALPRSQGRSQQIDDAADAAQQAGRELHARSSCASRSGPQTATTRSRTNPFQPHAVARTPHLAYQYNVVMKYLDNLIAWGDSLFTPGHRSRSINEATQLLRARRQPPRARARSSVPQRGSVAPQTFAQLKAAGLDAMGNALVELEGQFPFNFASAPPTASAATATQRGPLFGIGRSLYFCIPRNDKLLGYWDTVADRLFKIRNCMNIEGVVRQLPLFDPPIDPGMLVKAAAAGHRHRQHRQRAEPAASGPCASLPLIQKALELCARGARPRQRPARGASRRATPSSGAAAAAATRSSIQQHDAGRALPAVEAGRGGDRVAAASRAQRARALPPLPALLGLQPDRARVRTCSPLTAAS